MRAATARSRAHIAAWALLRLEGRERARGNGTWRERVCRCDDKAIASGDYDAEIRDKAARGITGEELFFDLAITDGVDGWVSLFSADHYRAAAEAYLRGIERRIAAGLSPRVGSVAEEGIVNQDEQP